MTESLPEINNHEVHAGENIVIGEQKFVVEKVSDGRKLAEEFGLTLSRYVPVYYLDGISPRREGAYHPKLDCILVFKNTEKDILKHEIIHAIEFPQEKSPGLLSLYERAKAIINEDSFSGNLVSFNFRKNISEFIADGYTKSALIDALKKEGLYEEFLKETAYLFDNP